MIDVAITALVGIVMGGVSIYHSPKYRRMRNKERILSKSLVPEYRRVQIKGKELYNRLRERVYSNGEVLKTIGFDFTKPSRNSFTPVVFYLAPFMFLAG